MLTSKYYDPVRWDTYWHMQPCPFVMKRLERGETFGSPRLVDAWWHAVTTQPLAYLRHRATFATFIGTNLVLPYYISRGRQRRAAAILFKPLLELHLCGRPCVPAAVLLILAVGVCAIALPARTAREHSPSASPPRRSSA